MNGRDQKDFVVRGRVAIVSQFAIENYIDNYEEWQKIEFGNETRNEIWDFFLDKGMPNSLAEKYTEKYFKKIHRGRLSKKQFKEHFSSLGYDSHQIKSFMYSSTYKRWRMSQKQIMMPLTKIEMLSDMDAKHLQLKIYAHSAFSLLTMAHYLLPTGQPLLPDRPSYHDKVTDYNRFGSWHSLTIYLNDEFDTMLTIVNSVFDKLMVGFKEWKAGNFLNSNWQALRDNCIDFVKHFDCDRARGFPGINYDLRQSLPASPWSSTWKPYSPNTTLLIDAISQRDYDRVEYLLESGVDVQPKDYRSSVLTIAFPKEDKDEIASPDEIVRLFALLLDFGAPCMSGFSHGSALGDIIYHIAVRPMTQNNPRKYAAYEKILFHLMHYDDGRTPSYLDDYLIKKDPFAALVAQGQKQLRKRCVPASLFTASSHIRYSFKEGCIDAPSFLKYHLVDKSQVGIYTLPLDQLNMALKKHGLSEDALFTLFKKNFSACHMSSIELRSYYDDLMQDIQGRPYIDLIFHVTRLLGRKFQKKLVGFNVTQYIELEIPQQKECVIIHHVKLTVFDEETVRYTPALKGLGTIIAFYRGFLPLQYGFKTKVLNLCEVASMPSLIRLAEYNAYPKQKTLELYFPLLREKIYKGKIEYDPLSQVWYFADKLAQFEPKQQSSIWITPSQFSTERFFQKPSLLRNKKSLVMLFECNSFTYGKYLVHSQQCVELPLSSSIQIINSNHQASL